MQEPEKYKQVFDSYQNHGVAVETAHLVRQLHASDKQGDKIFKRMNARANLARPTRFAVFKALSETLAQKPREALLDLFSGMGYSTVPLLLTGRTSHLTMVDNDPVYENGISALMNRLTKLEPWIKYQKGEIRAEKHINLPSTRNVVLINTGFTLPDEISKPHNTPILPDLTNEKLLRWTRGIRVSDSIDLRTVLATLEDTTRVVHVFELPREGSTEALKKTVAHLTSTLESTNGWKHRDWKEDTQTGMISGKLVLE